MTAINLHSTQSTVVNVEIEAEAKTEKPPEPEPVVEPAPSGPAAPTGRWVLTATKKLDRGTLDLGKVRIVASAEPGKAQIVYEGDISKGADFSQGLLRAKWTPETPPAEIRSDQEVRFEGSIEASGGSPGTGGVKVFPEGSLEMECPSGWGTNLCLFRASAGTPPSGAWRTRNEGEATLEMGSGKPGQERVLTISLISSFGGVGFEYTYAWTSP